MKTRFVGDIHGKWMSYLNVILPAGQAPGRSIQVGDFGHGFEQRREHVDYLHKQMQKGDHRFIRGNHDDPAVCKHDPQAIADGHVENGMMFIGGANSIDRDRRTPGVDWWEDEELSYDELFKLVEVYEKVKPRIVVTHECPESIVPHLFEWYNKMRLHSRTREALDSMLNIHKPELWIFGHWHGDRDVVIDGTRFICLNELSHIDIDLDDTSSGKITPWIKF